jgi:ABC-type branched-subunit amino acid transport system substrate-binding protein
MREESSLILAKNTMVSTGLKYLKPYMIALFIGTLSLFVAACQPASVSQSEQEKKDLKDASTNTAGAQALEDLLNRNPSTEDLSGTPTAKPYDPLMRLYPQDQNVIGVRAVPTTDNLPIKIAILLPLSGQHEAIGNDLLNAANMALFDLSDAHMQLLPFDTKGTVQGAQSAAAEALVEGAELILGPLFSTSVPTVRDLAKGRGVNVVTFSTDTTVAGDGVYMMGLTVGQQIHRVMEFSYRQGLLNFAVLAPDGPYGDAVISNVQSSSEALGLSVEKVMRYPTNVEPGSQELHEIAKSLGDYTERQKLLTEEIKLYEKETDAASKAYVKRLERMDTFGEVSFDALVIPEGGARLKELAPLLSYYDIDPEVVKFIGTGLWADQSLGSEPALVGGWFSAPSPVKARAFSERFTETYGYPPSRIASLAYDATALAGLLARDPAETRFDQLALENANGFTGYDGIFRFPQSGVAERGLAILEVGQKELKVLDPAPTEFQQLVN